MKANKAPWPVVGQDKAIQYLQTSLRKGALASAYLFHGPNAVGKRTTARAFLQTVLCLNGTERGACGSCVSCQQWSRGLHPDAFFVDLPQEGLSIGIESVRALQLQLSRKP